MKLKLKALGLGVLAVVAIATLGGSATATGGGHFVSGAEHTEVKLAGNEEGHNFTWVNWNGPVACGTAIHDGTISATTVSSIDLVPIWKDGCLTGDEKTPMVFTPNGCTFRLTIASETTANTEQTFDLVCPAGKVFEVHQGPTCLLTMVPQTVANAATYTTTITNGKHAITVDLNATIETQFHGGICVFMGTKQFTTLKGSAVMSGYDTALEPVSLTAT